MTSAGRRLSLDEFKARLPLVEIISRHVRLTRRGRELTGLCPFHREKTPSFTVSEAKGFYHCFGCGQHGNAIDFVMAVEGLDFADAIRRLADLTGLPLPQQAGGDGAAPDRSLLAANEAAARWFAGRLASAGGAQARAYLAGRGLDDAALARFGLGYAPDERGALKAALAAEGFAEGQLEAAGLLARPDDGGPSYDRFRHRLMFPIHDGRGRIVGFGGRALGEARAKYLNTPETELFHKGQLLYGLHLARVPARERGTVIVAEGYMDVIAVARAGLPNAVAPLGTAVSEAQLGLLWQLADEPHVCLDSDEAGLRAAHRLIERALPLLKPGKSLRFVLLPPGQDPDSLLRSAGPEALRGRIEEALPLIDFLWQRELSGRSLATPERRAAFRQRLRDLTETIANRELRWLFWQELAGRLRARLDDGGRRRGRQPERPAVARFASAAGGGRLAGSLAQIERLKERALIGTLLVHPEILPEVEEELATLELVDPQLDLLRQHIISWYAEHGHLDPSGVCDHLCAVGFAGELEQLRAETPLSALYRQGDLQAGGVLEGWRMRLSQHRFALERRGAGRAFAGAITGGPAEAAQAYRLAVDRLLNRCGGIAPRTGDDET
jgi:DNA primase